MCYDHQLRLSTLHKLCDVVQSVLDNYRLLLLNSLYTALPLAMQGFRDNRLAFCVGLAETLWTSYGT
jgi:hypothetical protein